MNRRRVAVLAAAAAVVGLLAVALAVFAGNGNGNANASGTARRAGTPAAPVPALAPAGAPPSGSPVDGVGAAGSERFVMHIHAHLAVFVNGRQRAVPGGIGIAPPRQVQPTADGPFVTGGSLFYWLHTHTADGIVHIEAPVARTFTLGQFFAVWGQPLGRDRVGPAAGRVTAFLDGRRYGGDPRRIPLRAHALIQLEVGRPLVAPAPVTFPPGL
jgi:hypothetical protein